MGKKKAIHTMKGFCLRSWQSSASAPAAVEFLLVKVRWGKAPESKAMTPKETMMVANIKTMVHLANNNNKN